MRISGQGLELIKQFEGFSASAYLCPAGLRTIGYGHVLKAGEAETVDEVQAEQWLRQDVRIAEAAVARLISRVLTQGQFDALVSFTFNLGGAALQRSRLRRMVNRGEHAAVPGELTRWVYARGRVLSGLVARRAAEGRLYMENERVMGFKNDLTS